MRYVQLMALMVAFSAAVALGMGKSEGPKKTQEAVKPAAGGKTGSPGSQTRWAPRPL